MKLLIAVLALVALAGCGKRNNPSVRVELHDRYGRKVVAPFISVRVRYKEARP